MFNLSILIPSNTTFMSQSSFSLSQFFTLSSFFLFFITVNIYRTKIQTILFAFSIRFALQIITIVSIYKSVLFSPFDRQREQNQLNENKIIHEKEKKKNCWQSEKTERNKIVSAISDLTWLCWIWLSANCQFSSVNICFLKSPSSNNNKCTESISGFLFCVLFFTD